MKLILNSVLLLISTLTTLGQEIVKTETFYGNNNYHVPASFVETKEKWDSKQIESFSKKTYERLPEQEGSVCTVLNWKNQPYAIIYNHKAFSYEVKDTIFRFEDFVAKYERMIKNFESLKAATQVAKHTIYGYYASLGGCANRYDAGMLTVITKDSLENYFMTSTYLCKGCSNDPIPITRTKGGFRKEYKVWTNFREPEEIATEIYEERGKDILVKDLHYVKEEDKMYIYYLMRIR
jgi:hypothetical protein